MGKGGASKGKVAAATPVSKPWLKKAATAPVKATAVSKGSAKASGKSKTSVVSAKAGGKSTGKSKAAPVKTTTISAGKGKGASAKGSGKKGGGNWVFVPTGKSSSPKVGGKSKGKGKGKGKKGRRPAAVNSDFWSTKLEEEAREELDGQTYTGVIHRYTWAQAWGLIKPDDATLLPERVQAALAEAAANAIAKAAEKGKDPPEDAEGMLYFRKPDIKHQEGFKVTKDVAVTFSVYMDEKGAGAYDVAPSA